MPVPVRSAALPENHPLTMARLQQSARDILRNLESAMANGSAGAGTGTLAMPSSSSSTTFLAKSAGNPSTVPAVSLEQTLRSMFTSCTFGAGMTGDDDVEDDEDGGDGETDSRTTAQLGGVPKVGTSSTDSSSSIDAPVKPKVKRSKSASQHPAKKLISSTKENLRRLASRHVVESSHPNPTAVTPPPHHRPDSTAESSPSKTAVAHIYEHLFFAEEHARRTAATAVAVPTPNAKDATPATSISHRPIVSPPFKNDVSVPQLPDQSNVDRVGIIPLRRMTQPFPISKPHATGVVPIQSSTPHQPVHTVSTSISRNFTFDDDISAISAHTLEAMMMTIPQQTHSYIDIQRNQDTPLESPAATDFHTNFPTLNKVTPPPMKSAIPLSNAAFCRASTIPRANQANNEARDVERINSLSSTSTFRSKQRRSSSDSVDRSNARSPPGFRYGTPSSHRSVTSNNSQQQQRFGSSFSPCTSGSGNQSFDRWKIVEQEFWDSVVANEDDREPGAGIIPGAQKKSMSGKHPRRSRSRIRSFDGWSEHSTHSRTRDPLTDGSIFSSSLTGISHSGSGHGPLSQERSQSWLALHPQQHPHETFPVIFASTAIPDNDGFFLEDRPFSSSFHFDAMESGEI